MCEHRFIEVVGTKLDFEKSDNGRIETTVRRKACHKCYKTKTEIELEQQLAAANAELAETYTDEHGTVWTRPTAWAYAAVCKANDKIHPLTDAQAKGIAALIEQQAQEIAKKDRMLEKAIGHLETACCDAPQSFDCEETNKNCRDCWREWLEKEAQGME